MSSTCKSLKVFDFSEEDELPDIASAKFSCKFKSANAVDKYNLLEEVACGVNVQSKKIDGLQHVDVDATDNDRNGDNTDSPLDMEREDCATKGISGLDDDLQFSSVDHEDHPQFISNRLEPGSISALSEVRASSPRTTSPGNSQLNCAVLESLSSDESVDVVSDSVENMNENSSSTQSDVAEDGVCMDGALSDPCIGSCKMDNGNMAVAICPEYVIYRDKYCTESVLVFSGSCINMKGSTAYGNQGTFKFHWGLDDIIEIESQFFRRVETAIVKLRVMSKREVQAESLHDTSGIEELKFAIVDPDWYKKQDEIVSLDLRYKALWNVVFDAEMGKDGEALIGQNGVHIPGFYFPNFDEPFEEVVYPKGDADAVCISKRDVDLLQPDTFVNDTIIDFYIKYLKNQIKTDERHRFHFFNSFFFRKLADLDKDPSSAFDGRAAFQRVRKWTRKVNLFEKDYIFIPINFNFHWSLIVVCHPGEVVDFQDEDVVKSLKVPCILHMDSIKGSHTGLKDLVQSYLWEEWKERQKDACEDMSPKFFNLRFVPLELPQQQNSFDCGLFLLHYVELFLDEAPVNFSPFKITKLSNFLTVDWFPPAEASLKRVLIQRLIYELLENHPQEISLANHADKHCTNNLRRSNNDNETGVEFLSESCSPLKSCPGNLLTSRTSQGIEMTLLPTSYLRNTQCASDSGLVLREFFEPGATAGSFLVGQQYQAFDQPASFNEFKSAMSIEGDVEPGDHFAYSPSTGSGFQRLAEITPESCSFPYSSRDFGAETSWHPGISIPPAGHEDIGSSPETSLCVSDDNSFEVEVNRDNIDGDAASVEMKIDQPSPPLRENIDCLTESQPSAPSEMVGGNGDACPLTSSPNTITGLSHEDFNEMQQNKDVTSDDVRLIDDDSDSDMQQVAKRLRLTPSPEEERKITRSPSGDLQL